jgi:molybdate transport system ATP-binding protein
MSRLSQPPLVELRNIRLTLGGKVVLSNVSWAVYRGEGWLVTGANGAGKTSLLQILAGRIWPDPGSQGGMRRYHFDKTASDSPIGLEGRLAWLSPETHQRFARLDAPLSAGDAILTGFAHTLLLTHRPTPVQRATARAFADKLGLARFWRRPFPELSQGQQRLVLLARALAAKPRLLVLDEFSDGLDCATQILVGAVIRQRLQAGVAVVVATHRSSDILPGLTRHLVMRKGATKEIPMTKGKPQHKLRKRIGKPLLLSPGAPILEFTHASISIGDHAKVKRILHDIHWTVLPGEHWAVLGPNGSGKSTLLRAIYGELPVARGGALQRFGRTERELPLPEARRQMGWVSPALHHNYTADNSVAEVVASGFQSSIGLLRSPSSHELVRAQAALCNLGVGRLAGRRWGTLSFGETRLVLLARALALKPRLLLLDEPCDGLAPGARNSFLRAVACAAQAGAQIIVAAHRAEDLPVCVNRTLHLNNGRMI